MRREKSSEVPEQAEARGVLVLADDWNADPRRRRGGLIGKMRRKDEMETVVTKKAPQDGSTQRPRRAHANNHKALITRNLRLAFGEVASEPVPDRFLELLNRLDTAEEKKQ